MATWNSPAVARRWLAHELRRLREERGLAQRDVGKACGWSGVRVSYIENAQQNVVAADLTKLLPLYGVPKASQDAFHEAADASRRKGWWERYDHRIVPDYLVRFIGLEQGASLIRTAEPTIVPGLFQTRQYMIEALGADLVPRGSAEMDRIASVRLERQQVLRRKQDPLRVAAVIDESVLRRVVGAPSTMAEQLRRIAELCELPNVEFHVFPFEGGISPGGVTASYRILHFPSGTPPVVYVEYRGGAQWLEDEESVATHEVAFDEHVRAALSLEDSRDMVLEIAADYERRTC